MICLVNIYIKMPFFFTEIIVLYHTKMNKNNTHKDKYINISMTRQINILTKLENSRNMKEKVDSFK